MAKKEKILLSKDRFSDNYSETHNNVLDFITFLEDMEENSKRWDVNLKNISAKNIALGPILAPHVQETNNFYNASLEAIAETVDDGSSGGVAGSRMLVTAPIDGETKAFLLSSTGLASLISRAGLDCPVIHKLNIEDLEKTINTALKYAGEKQVSILHREDKIRAFNGANTYVSLSPCKMITAIVKMLDSSYNGYTFKGGNYTHQKVMCSFELTGDTTEIMETYKNACEGIGSVKNKNLKVCFDFQTSEIGDDCAVISVSLVRGQLKIVLGSPISVVHNGDVSEETFINQLPQLLAKTKDLVAGLQKLMDLEVKHPINCILNLAKYAGLAKTQTMSAIAEFQNYMDNMLKDDKNAKFTAHDVFYVLQETLMAMRKANVANSTIEKCEENIARTLVDGFDWSGHDVSVRPDWGVSK